MERDPYRYFRVEAKELVDHLSRGVLELGQEAGGKETVAALLRVAHTLKGAAHVVKQAEIAKLAHHIEDTLLPYADLAAPAAAAATKDLLQLIDAISAQLSHLGGEAPKVSTTEAAAPVEEAFETLRIDIAEMDRLLEGVNEIGVQLAGLKAKLAAVEQVASLASLLQSVTQAAAGTSARNAAAAAKAKSLAEDLRSLGLSAYRSLSTGLEQITRELTQVRDGAGQLRLVPASAIFIPLQRAVRNAAESLQKQVELTTGGGDHRLDAHVLSAVRNVLLHVVRNAVAHGIEPVSERAAAGKPASGKVSLRVERRGSRVAFICQDDGRGFDVAALRRVAVARKLISAEEAHALGPKEMIRLIFRGGVSTADTPDEVSGRGIGLDVVRQTAASLKADLNVETETGVGASIEICVPVSLLSVEAITVQSAGTQVSVPLDAVRQTLRLRPGDVVSHSGGQTILFEEKSIPYLPLQHVLRSQERQSGQEIASALVVAAGGEIVAVGVDRILDAGSVVLRPIPAVAGVSPVVAGASLDSEGNPQLVLDPGALVAAATAQSGEWQEPTVTPPPAVLVIDDSLTSRILHQSILESAGFEVDLAGSGEEALEKCRQRRYNLFVVDVEMPGMDGFEFIARTQQDAALRAIPSVLVTSRSSAQDRQRGTEVGARGYMSKTEFDQQHLLSTIRQLVN